MSRLAHQFTVHRAFVAQQVSDSDPRRILALTCVPTMFPDVEYMVSDVLRVFFTQPVQVIIEMKNVTFLQCTRSRCASLQVVALM